MSEFNEENIDGFDSNEEEIFNHWAGPDHEENKKMLKFSVDLITEVTSDLSVLINEQIKDYVDSFKAQCIVLKKGDFTDEMRKDLLQFLRGCIMSTEAIEKRIQQ